MGAINPKEDYTNIPHETFDAVIVGGGGSGMRASYQLAQAGLKVAVLTKSIPNSFAHCCSAGWYWCISW